MKGWLLALTTVLVLALLTACATTLNSAPTFEAAGGTFNYSESSGASFLLIFRPPNGATDQIEVSISGPAGWNDGQPLVRHYKSYSDTRIVWLNVYRNDAQQPTAVISGKYSINATIEGVTYSREVDIDATKTLDRITAISEDRMTPSELQLSWSPLPEAKSYFVELEDPTLAQGFQGFYTSAPTASFSGLAFNEGEEYTLRITAFNVDFTQGTNTHLPVGQFNASYTAAILSYP